jgi:hypothetical protein
MPVGILLITLSVVPSRTVIVLSFSLLTKTVVAEAGSERQVISAAAKKARACMVG